MAPAIEFTITFNSAASRDRLIAWAQANFDVAPDADPLTPAELKLKLEEWLREGLRGVVLKWEGEQAAEAARAALPSIED